MLDKFCIVFDIKKHSTAHQLGMWHNIRLFFLLKVCATAWSVWLTVRLGSLWLSRAKALLFLVCIYSSLNTLNTSYLSGFWTAPAPESAPRLHGGESEKGWAAVLSLISHSLHLSAPPSKQLPRHSLETALHRSVTNQTTLSSSAKLQVGAVSVKNTSNIFWYIRRLTLRILVF